MGYDKGEIKTSPNIATVGRMLLVFSQQWDGERPGIVVRMGVGEGQDQAVNINVMLDGPRDQKLLEGLRRSVQGNTFHAIRVYDALTPTEREVMVAEHGMIAEWPRLPTVAARA